MIGVMCSVTSVATARTQVRVVRYLGYTVEVPAAWPVIDLVQHPRACVRFDRHAVYLGMPSAQARCPAHAVGRTESLLLAPLAAHAASGSASGALPLEGAAAHVVRSAGRVAVTATWGRDPGLIKRVTGIQRLPGAASLDRSGAGLGSPTATPRAETSAARAGTLAPRARASAVTTGLGFDACSAPSAGAMRAWASSPYRTIGVYIGGAMMACRQSNLTAAWVQQESAAGWHFIPTYVGLQAPGNSCGCAAIDPSHAGSQGAAEATDAVIHARAVGLGNGTPIYFDMEAYRTGGSATATVKAFLSAWTSTLHADGYLSGVYSSGDSGIRDLVAAQGTWFVEPDDIWTARWNGSRSTYDPAIPSNDWAAHQRIHQYSGGQNVTYGGVTINIDGDYIDAATGGRGGPAFPDGTFVQVTGTSNIYRMAGGAPLLITSWTGFGGPQPVTIVSPAQFAALYPVPAERTFLVTTSGRTFRVAGGSPLPVSSWTVFGGQQAAVTIDQWDIDNISDPAAHLRPQPAVGTVVEGLPSASYWRFVRGGRIRVAPTATAVPVDDVALNGYAALASGPPPRPKPKCVVPNLRRMPIRALGGALSRAHCRLGKIRRPRHVRRYHVLRVSKQTPWAHRVYLPGYKVGVWVR
jgi:hypothetical protein